MTDMAMICLPCGARMAAERREGQMAFQCTSDECGHRQALDLQPQ